MNTPRTIVMGTPVFAVTTLDALLAAGIDVAAVVTAPDRPAGRGRKPRPSPMKERALEAGIPVLQPDRLRDPLFLDQLDKLGADLFVVVAFRMLPEAVWSRPPLGSINLHASLLPDYRGAAPINWAVINGEERTGVTTFLIGRDIDTGDLLLQKEMTIGPDETAGELHDRMMVVGADLVVRTVHGLAQGVLRPLPQDGSAAVHPAPKIDTGTCRLDMTRPAARVHDLVRGMSPLPGAWCTWEEPDRPSIHFKVLRTRRTSESTTSAPGTVHITEGRLLVACGDAWLEALEVQPEGKRRMTSQEFLRGIRVHDGIMMR